MEEQRATARERAFRPGTIQLGERSISCIVRNVSNEGAALDVVSPDGIPDNFVLVLTLDGVRHSCRVIWRQDMRIGVVFDALPGYGDSRIDEAPMAPLVGGPLARRLERLTSTVMLEGQRAFGQGQ